MARNPYELRMECIQIAENRLRERYQEQKAKFEEAAVTGAKFDLAPRPRRTTPRGVAFPSDVCRTRSRQGNNPCEEKSDSEDQLDFNIFDE